MEKISAVTTTFNDEQSIIVLLDEIMQQTHLPDEIVIVDGGSADGTVAMIEKYSLACRIPIRLIAEGKRRNISKGFNDAIKNAKYNWILIIATGNRYDRNFIEKLTNESGKKSAHIIYGALLGVEKTYFAHVFNQWFLWGNQPRDTGASNHGVLIDAMVFKKIGYFEENFIYAGEDTEYFERVRKNQIECTYVYDTKIYWDSPQTWQEYLIKMKSNSIADWQLNRNYRIQKISVAQILFLALYAGMTAIWPKTFLLMIPVIIFFGIKKKTFNVLSILFGIFNRYVMIYFYIKNRKYAVAKYHISEEYQME